MQAYSDPSRENDPTALPDVEIFYAREGYFSGKPNVSEAGYYYWFRFPGCIPDSEATGPYDSENDALNAMRAEADPGFDWTGRRTEERPQ